MTFLLAPLQGVTTSLYRGCHFRHFSGLDAALSPFIGTVHQGPATRHHLRDVLPEPGAHVTVIPQVIGNDPLDLATLCEALAELGYGEVNWNLGCPFRAVTRKGRGAGLLPQPDRIVAILAHLCSHTRACLSLKARLGLTDPTELERLLPRLDDFPLRSITIHPRTALQEYGGAVDLDAFERCCGRTRHTLIYNGDITSLQRFEQVQERFGTRVSGWMIGRGAIADPFLSELLSGRAAPTPDERRQRFVRFHDELFGAYAQCMHGPAHLLDKMKELWKYWHTSWVGGAEALRRARKLKQPDEYQHLVHTFLSTTA
jgi:tRNA-dihydrouridine synthase B